MKAEEAKEELKEAFWSVFCQCSKDWNVKIEWEYYDILNDHQCFGVYAKNTVHNHESIFYCRVKKDETEMEFSDGCWIALTGENVWNYIAIDAMNASSFAARKADQFEKWVNNKLLDAQKDAVDYAEEYRDANAGQRTHNEKRRYDDAVATLRKYGE